jgi:simple sugar transport system permease protein
MKIAGITVKTERRGVASWPLRVFVPMAAVLLALTVGACVLGLQGAEVPPPSTVYLEGLKGSFGSRFAVSSTLMEAAPLALTAAGAAIAFRASLVNLGGEGQLYLGAIGAAAVGIGLGEQLPGVATLPLALVVGALAGALWALVAAVPRARWGTNEILPTLMLNFVALNVMNYLIFGSASMFRDDVVSTFPTGKELPTSARLPIIDGQLDASPIIAFAAVLLLAAIFASTRWGYRIRVAGDSPDAARYAGISIRRIVLSAFGISGAFAGLAGAVLVTGDVGALEPRTLAVGLGFTGLLVAVLARFSFVAVIPVAILIGAFETSAPAVQVLGVPESLILMLEGLVLLFVAIGEYVLRHRFVFESAGRPSMAAASLDVT